MKDEAIALVKDLDPVLRLNVLREYLQAYALRSLHESEAFLSLSFVGGTALRFLFNLPRFSEDLDLSVETSAGYDPVRWMEKLRRDLTLAGFDSTLKWNDRKTVHTAWIRVAGLLKETGLAGLPQQKLSIKIEIDTNPPAGARTIAQVITRHVMFAIRHHDLSSLMAGKLHALLMRPYPKGRDWYDLVWYLSKRPPVQPNHLLLQNALDQTQGVDIVDAAQWATHINQRLNSLDMVKIVNDVGPFLERPRDAELLTIAHLRAALKTEDSDGNR